MESTKAFMISAEAVILRGNFAALGKNKPQAHRDGDGDQDPEKANPETSSTTTGA